MKRQHYLLLSIISLATGIMVYILFHPVPLAFDLIPWIKSFPSIQIHSPIMKQFTQCYAADLFWAVSFAFIIQSIVMIPKKKAVWLLLTALLGISVELLQLLHMMKGVFDSADILVYLIGALISALTVRFGGKEHDE